MPLLHNCSIFFRDFFAKKVSIYNSTLNINHMLEDSEMSTFWKLTKVPRFVPFFRESAQYIEIWVHFWLRATFRRPKITYKSEQKFLESFQKKKTRRRVKKGHFRFPSQSFIATYDSSLCKLASPHTFESQFRLLSDTFLSMKFFLFQFFSKNGFLSAIFI